MSAAQLQSARFRSSVRHFGFAGAIRMSGLIASAWLRSRCRPVVHHLMYLATTPCAVNMRSELLPFLIATVLPR